MKKTLLLAFLTLLSVTPALADGCSDPALEEARITDQLAKEPNRPHLVVEKGPLKVFLENMKFYFNADPYDIDKVYLIMGLRPYPDPYVHMFVLSKGCIVYYTRTDPALIAKMLKRQP